MIKSFRLIIDAKSENEKINYQRKKCIEKGYCVLFQNGQCVFSSGQSKSVYLNDEIWNPTYQDLVIFDIDLEKFNLKLVDLLDTHDIFMPFNLMQTKTIEDLTYILVSAENYLFLFREGVLIFIFKFDTPVLYYKIKMNKNSKVE